MPKLTALIKSRRFWAAIAGLAVVLADPLGLDPQTMQDTVMLIAVWIVGDSIKSTA